MASQDPPLQAKGLRVLDCLVRGSCANSQIFQHHTDSQPLTRMMCKSLNANYRAPAHRLSEGITIIIVRQFQPSPPPLTERPTKKG